MTPALTQTRYHTLREGEREGLQTLGGGSQGVPQDSRGLPRARLLLLAAPAALTAPHSCPGPACLAGGRRTYGDPDGMSTPGPGERSTPAQPSYAKKKGLYTEVDDCVPSQLWDTCHSTPPVFNMHHCHFSSFAKQL